MKSELEGQSVSAGRSGFSKTASLVLNFFMVLLAEGYLFFPIVCKGQHEQLMSGLTITSGKKRAFNNLQKAQPTVNF